MKRFCATLTIFAIQAVTGVQTAAGQRILSESEEIALALSAAPSNLTDSATVLVLKDNRYVTAREGSNGVTCMVSRGRPHSLEPICYDPEASRTIMPMQKWRVELRLNGVAADEIERRVLEGVESGEFSVPTKPALAYMMSADQVLYQDDTTRVGSWFPHMHIFSPYATANQHGLSGEPSTEATLLANAGKPNASLIVLLRAFSGPADGERVFSGARAAQEVEISDAGWLSGCWVTSSEKRVTEETWMAPAGGMMLGMSRSVTDGVATGYEFLVLRVIEGRLVYSAHPSGQQPTDFRATSISSAMLRFENPSHDFPKRIDYVRVSRDSLVARVFAETQSPVPAFEVRYQGVKCSQVPGLSGQGAQVVVGPNIAIPGDDPGAPIVEPHLAIYRLDPARMIAAATVVDPASKDVWIGSHIDVFVTNDGSDSWSQHRLGMVAGVDPWLSVDPKGRAFLSYLGLRSDPRSVELLYHTSTDGGSSWSAPASLGSGHDRETMTSAWFGRGSVTVCVDLV